jgi:hypothetical protein
MRALSRTGLLLAALSAAAASCVEKGEIPNETFRMRVTLTQTDGSPVVPEQTLCLDVDGEHPECPHDFLVGVEAVDKEGKRDVTFNGNVRLTVRPGTVVSIEGDSSQGRNIQLKDGIANPQKVTLALSFGPTRLEAEDLGYQPGDPLDTAHPPACANGVDDDEDGLVDYPGDPGCFFANDDTETGGTHAAGVSPVIAFSYPTVMEAQGLGSRTPYEQEGIILETERSEVLVVRVSSEGFFVSDVTTDAKGVRRAREYGSMYVFNFSTPPGVRVCDRVAYLGGTMSEFFGYTEMSFPSYRTADQPNCNLPEPVLLGPTDVSRSDYMEKWEGGLVRLEGAWIAKKLGDGLPATEPFSTDDPQFPCPGGTKYVFSDTATNCDLDGSGGTDFERDTDEASCFCWCYNQDVECSEYSAFRGRGNYRIVLGNRNSPSQTAQLNTGTIATFDPRAHLGERIPWITGTLANFSGGNLNWTIEARCADDLVLCPAGVDCQTSPVAPKSVNQACVRSRTGSDSDPTN